VGPEPELEHEPIQVVGVFLVFEVVIDSTDMCRVLGNNFFIDRFIGEGVDGGFYVGRCFLALDTCQSNRLRLSNNLLENALGRNQCALNGSTTHPPTSSSPTPKLHLEDGIRVGGENFRQSETQRWQGSRVFFLGDLGDGCQVGPQASTRP
jgi:hypothetical protein